MDLTVIMPVYNAEKYVSEAVRSTLDALPPSAELLVLNDGSTDSSAKRLSEIRDSRLRILESEANLGVAGGLNLLLESAEGQLIARMDADDVCERDRFVHQMSRMHLVDATFCSVTNIDVHGRVMRRQLGSSLSPMALPFHLLLTNMLVHPGLMARRSSLSAGYTSTAAEDYELWLRLVGEGARIERTGFRGLRYRRHASQISKNQLWLDRVRLEFENGGPLVESYVSAYRVVVGESPSPVCLEFAMNLGGQRSDVPELWRASSRLSARERIEFGARVLTTTARARLR